MDNFLFYLKTVDLYLCPPTIVDDYNSFKAPFFQSVGLTIVATQEICIDSDNKELIQKLTKILDELEDLLEKTLILLKVCIDKKDEEEGNEEAK